MASRILVSTCLTVSIALRIRLWLLLVEAAVPPDVLEASIVPCVILLMVSATLPIVAVVRLTLPPRRARLCVSLLAMSPSLLVVEVNRAVELETCRRALCSPLRTPVTVVSK